MEMFDTGKLLARIGALLTMIAGVAQTGEYALYMVIDLFEYGYTGPYMILWTATGILALIFGILLLLIFIPMAEKNRTTGAVLIIIFSILGAAAAWDWAIIGAPGAILCLVGAILFFIESEEGGA
jgi:hypothetical protein